VPNCGSLPAPSHDCHLGKNPLFIDKNGATQRTGGISTPFWQLQTNSAIHVVVVETIEMNDYLWIRLSTNVSKSPNRPLLLGNLDTFVDSLDP
jgi:hypothetical protein